MHVLGHLMYQYLPKLHLYPSVVKMLSKVAFTTGNVSPMTIVQLNKTIRWVHKDRFTSYNSQDIAQTAGWHKTI